MWEMKRLRRECNFLSVCVVFILCVLTIIAAPSPVWGAPFAGGDGSSTDPFIIETPEQLEEVRDALYLGEGYYFRLENNINLSNYLTGDGWLPIGTGSDPFIGNFDGGGFRITGLWISRSGEFYVGLFGATEDATIKNLGVEIDNSRGGVQGTSAVGGLVGYMNNSNIESSHATRNVTATDSGVGGLVGSMNNSNIENSHATGNVTGSSSFGGAVGGLVGSTNGDVNITSSYATGTVTGHVGVGGLVGSTNDDINITSSYATGTVTGRTGVGGLIGSSSMSSTTVLSVTSSYATGNVNAAQEQAGGLVGGFRGNISLSYATGNVTSFTTPGSSALAGGLVGTTLSRETRIENSYATGNVTTAKGITGGLVGYLQGYIENSYATGDVTASHQAGGLVGSQVTGGNITNSYATGNVTATDGEAGGLVGLRDPSAGAITDSYRYALAEVTANGGPVDMSVNPGNIHGGTRTAAELLTQSTYSNNGWRFTPAYSPTPIGPWHWDVPRRFPKLNLGTESYPFRFGIPPFKLPEGTPPNVEAVDYEMTGPRADEGLARLAAEAALSGEGILMDISEIIPFPVISAYVSKEGNVAAVGIPVLGSELMAEQAKDVKVVKILGPDSDTPGKLFGYERIPGNFDDKKFTVLTMDNEVMLLGTIQPNTFYWLVLFIKDGGEFDLDGEANGTVIDPIALVGERRGGGSGGGGGCDAMTANAGLWRLALFVLIGVACFAAGRKNFCRGKC